ncbi:hypothetical protein F2P81_006639 [Scophthalmus maximus]|uniref:Ferric reductase NAD binding domain-containing protein n=1 Tax=Scophthalmus maximus TaxID=52904 RepID=A0A6A4TCX3_SCOMX|nr:hypothetical protein F2P81_006639 [Scophthalmus maximus]
MSRVSTFSLWEYLLTTRPGIGWVKGTASVTGVVLQVVICLMVLCSSTFVRRSGHFEVFYWSHLSYVWLCSLLMVHCANFWKWFLVPGLVFLLEKIVGIAVSRIGGLYVVEVNLLPSKEELFSCSDVTTAVASNQDDAIELTMYRQNGSQVGAEPPPDDQGPAERGEAPPLREVSAKFSENHRFCNIKCYVDGPYGTPTRQIFAAEHAVLIGAGIGITPFASILQSIMYRYRRRKQNCPSCNYSWCENIKDGDMKLRKVDFIWINRDQKSFEWFVSLLTNLEMDQADEEPEGRFLEMHMYMTSALSKNDMKAIGLQMALDLLAKKEKRDSITGLRTRTQPGRPEWGKLANELTG